MGHHHRKPLCIYHSPCVDGMTAAWAVWKKFGDRFDYHGMGYGDPIPDVDDRCILMVDFSFKRPQMIEIRDRSSGNVMVIDHHKTAIEELKGFTQMPRSFDDFKSTGDIQVLFDLKRSGAGLAWEFFHTGALEPLLVTYAEDYDLWRKELNYCEEINRYISSYEFNFENWENISLALVDTPHYITAVGTALMRFQTKQIRDFIKGAKHQITIRGVPVPALNCPEVWASEAGNILSSEVDTYAACYRWTPKGWSFSLRSHDGGMDVSKVAQSFGGGGHRNAAGFKVNHLEDL